MHLGVCVCARAWAPLNFVRELMQNMHEQGKFTAIMQELGHPSKTAAKTFAETFLYLLDNLEGQKAIMIVYDCG
jgi:predicted chitinase